MKTIKEKIRTLLMLIQIHRLKEEKSSIQDDDIEDGKHLEN